MFDIFQFKIVCTFSQMIPNKETKICIYNRSDLQRKECDELSSDSYVNKLIWFLMSKMNKAIIIFN